MVIRFPCACGRELELPDENAGETIECPWCAAPATAPGGEPAPPPSVVAPAAVPRPKRHWFAIGIAATLAAAAVGWLVARRFNPEGRRAAVYELVRERAARLRDVEPPGVDPAAVRHELRADDPDLVLAFTRAATFEEIEALWRERLAALDPDWALAMGAARPTALTQYDRASVRRRLLLDALALERLRAVPGGAGVERRLLERMLERSLLDRALFGESLRDPGAALWGIAAGDLLSSDAPADQREWR